MVSADAGVKPGTAGKKFRHSGNETMAGEVFSPSAATLPEVKA